HRQALNYKGHGADRDHPEYLFARRDNRLILNMVDTPDHRYVQKRMVDAAVDFIDDQIRAGRKVLVHCNQGGSRGPSIALLYMAQYTDALPWALGDALEVF